MGSPVSPIVANIFMQWFEDTALDTFPYEISLWKRYVDDTVVVLMDAPLEDFTNYINSIHPAIKFTREEETEKSLAVLDAKITRDNLGKLSFSVYRKPTHTDQYLQYSSNQPLQHKLGVIRTLVHHSNTICSNEAAQDYEINHVRKVLSVSGCSKKAWKVASTPNTRSEHPSPDVSRGTKGSVTIPYVGKVTDNIARLFRQAGVTTHIRPYNTIQSGTTKGQSPKM